MTTTETTTTPSLSLGGRALRGPTPGRVLPVTYR